MTVYLVLLALAMLAAIAPSFARGDSPLRTLRLIPMLAVYPLFVIAAVRQGVGVTAAWWGALAAVGVVLVLVADTALPRAEREPLFGVVWKTALLWPFVVPAATERLMIRAGVVPKPEPPRLPEPPRGAELMALPDDDLLVFAHLLLSSAAGQLTAEERTIFVAETFNREVHGGGFGQWLANTGSSVGETVDALRAVGASSTATLLQEAVGAIPATWSETQPLDARLRELRPMELTLRALDERFFSLERQEDLTSRVARFVRRHQARCPVLA